MEIFIKRDELEPEVLLCAEYVERAIESLYFDYYSENNFKIRNFNFTYRIEMDSKDKSIPPRIRLRTGSTKTPQKFYIGNAEPALKALVFLRNSLCNAALHDLQKLLDSDKFPLWFYKNSPDKEKICPYTPEELINMVFEIAKSINSKIMPWL